MRASIRATSSRPMRWTSSGVDVERRMELDQQLVGRAASRVLRQAHARRGRRRRRRGPSSSRSPWRALAGLGRERGGAARKRRPRLPCSPGSRASADRERARGARGRGRPAGRAATRWQLVLRHPDAALRLAPEPSPDAAPRRPGYVAEERQEASACALRPQRQGSEDRVHLARRAKRRASRRSRASSGEAPPRRTAACAAAVARESRSSALSPVSATAASRARRARRLARPRLGLGEREVGQALDGQARP